MHGKEPWSPHEVSGAIGSSWTADLMVGGGADARMRGGRRAQARTCFTVATVSGRACFSACCSSAAPRPGIGVPPPGIVEPSATRPSVSKKELSSRSSAPLQAAAGISRWGDILQTLRLSCDQSSLLVLSIRSMRRQLGPADAWRRLYRDSISHLRPKSGRECEPRPHPSSCRP